MPKPRSTKKRKYMFRVSISNMPIFWSNNSDSLGRDICKAECTSQQLESGLHSQVIAWGEKGSLFPIAIDVKGGENMWRSCDGMCRRKQANGFSCNEMCESSMRFGHHMKRRMECYDQCQRGRFLDNWHYLDGQWTS